MRAVGAVRRGHRSAAGVVPAERRHSPHRLLTFADAVVAIAITLLVLPLVDAAAASDPATVPLTGFLDRNLAAVGGFLLSFVVVLGLWRAHHDLFELLESVDPVLRWATFVWMLTVVTTPFTTQLVISYDAGDPGADLLYTGVLLTGSLCQTVATLWAVRHPELLRPEVRGRPVEIARTAAISALFALALVLALLLPDLDHASLLVLLLARPVVVLTRTVRDHRAVPRGGREVRT